MHLIDALAAGIRGAEGGTASLYLRGTASHASYYEDFEASQILDGTSVALDVNGSVVAYVAVLVDVKVYDSGGVLVREFVAGSEDAAVEVISPSFTGVDYTSGASGAQKPTTLASVLDAWVSSAGATDWKVLLNGSPTNLSAAFATTFFNVKNFGAVGNGVADDGSAISAAQAAAVAVGGGTVFFPPGTYRVTSAITLGANVTWLGSGGQSSKLAIDSAVSAGLLVLPGNSVGSISAVTGMWLTAINGAAPGSIVSANGASSGEFHFTDCAIDNGTLGSTALVGMNNTLATLKIVFTRCIMRMTGTSAAQILVGFNLLGRTIVRDCDLLATYNVGGTMVDLTDNLLLEGNRLDWSAATFAAVKYVNIAPVTGSVVIIGNTFAANSVVACTGIFNTLAAPFRDCMEYGNVFGLMSSSAPGCTPYGYTTDGYATLGTATQYNGHQTRLARTELLINVVAAAIAVDPKTYGSSTITRTAGGNLTVNATKGSLGDRWTLHISNTSGVGITVSGGTNVVFDPAAAPLAVGNGGFAEVNLQWLPTAGGAGNWYQTAKAVLS